MSWTTIGKVRTCSGDARHTEQVKCVRGRAEIAITAHSCSWKSRSVNCHCKHVRLQTSNCTNGVMWAARGKLVHEHRVPIDWAMLGTVKSWNGVKRDRKVKI